MEHERLEQEQRGFFTFRLPSGTRRRLKLGTFPATTLGEARTRALEAKGELERGHDPSKSRLEAVTLREAFDAYRSHELKRFRTGKAMAQDIERDVIATLGSRPLPTITREELTRILDRIERRAPVQANRVLQYTKAMFRRFVERGLLDASPAAALRKRTKEGTS